MTKIEWSEKTWNPVTGCDECSPGCKNCYARRMAERLQAMGNPKYRNGFKVTWHESELDKPLSWKKPQLIFVNSMSDIGHPDIPVEFVYRMFDTMRLAHWHTFQVLTKRPERIAECLPSDWGDGYDNVWLGTSVENQAMAEKRIPHLIDVPAKLRFLSCEPLLGEVDLLRSEFTWIVDGYIDWIIVGGESGPNCRPMQLSWAEDIIDICEHLGVSVFLKQLGGHPDKRGGEQAVIAGRRWQQLPAWRRTEQQLSMFGE